jgi:O-methyltransferase
MAARAQIVASTRKAAWIVRRSSAKATWVNEELGGFRREGLRTIFLALARFAHSNRPLHGYYFEFGSHGATTMRMAYDAFHHLFDWDYVSFDSFEGMPEPLGIDRETFLTAGMNQTSEADFRRLCNAHGIPADKLITVPGFYEASLPQAAARLLPRKAAVVYIDCDFYSSAALALKFSRQFLQRGTVIVFDDWNLYFGDPDRGERRAWREFREAEPELRFEPFVTTSEAASFICLLPA